MNKRIILYILCFILFLSGCTQKQKNDLRPDQSSCIPTHEMISDFYKARNSFVHHLLINDSDPCYKRKMMECWQTIVSNKRQVIRYLLESESLWKDSTYLLYGDVTKYYYHGSLMNDKEHSLFLIEAIQRNDYMFNKRGAPLVYAFLNEKNNFIYNTNNQTIDSLPSHFRYSSDYNSSFNVDMDSAWKIYKKWYFEDLFLLRSPIENTDFKWFSSSQALYGTDSSDYYNSIKDTATLKKLGYLGLWR